MHVQNVEGGTKSEHTQWHDEVHCTEGCMANSTLQPCGLGCHMLGPRHTTCLGTNLTPHLHRTGEDDSPKPS